MRSQTTSIMRCLLVPAVMTLLGKASWWMPSWLGRRLPRLSIEGEDYFAKRGARPPQAAGDLT
jgi:RND superfamily putative drug exporter